MEISREELDKWTDWLVGKPCPKHPNMIIQRGRYGNWCKVKTAFGWCDGGFPTEAYINELRKEKV